MARYRKGRLVGEIIKQLPTAGLPLFENEKTKKKDAAVKIAPKYIESGEAERNASYKIVVDALAKSQLLIYNAFMELGIATDREVSTFFYIPINKVTARRNELQELGLIIKAGVVFDDETKREVNTWRIKGENNDSKAT